MNFETHAALSRLATKAGFILGAVGGIGFMQAFRGMNWWMLQPAWVTLAPLVLGPVLGMVLGIQIMLAIPARCSVCNGPSRSRRGGAKQRWGYWCRDCGRDSLQPDEGAWPRPSTGVLKST